jgi:peptidoglycan/LPS O-acetylase OafA/YrhL
MRFFAALTVVLLHVGGEFAKGPRLLTAESYGYVGVTFFFLLSGFVLTWSYAHQPAGQFWWRRFARVWPAQFLMAIIAFTVLATQERIPSRLGQLGNLLLLQAWSPKQQVYYGGNGVSWSLSAEMFFYLLFPLAIILLCRLGRRGLAVTATITVAVLVGAPLVGTAAGVSTSTYSWLFFVFPPYRFGEFLLGMVVARALVLGLRVPVPRWTWLAGSLALAGALWGLTDYTRRYGEVGRPFVALIALPFFVLLLAAGAASDVQRGRWWLSSKPLLRLGEWSFPLYLVHKPVFLLTSRWGWWGTPGGVDSLVAFVAYLALAVGVAATLHYLVEKPIERRLRHLTVSTRKQKAARTQKAGQDRHMSAPVRVTPR